MTDTDNVDDETAGDGNSRESDTDSGSVEESPTQGTDTDTETDTDETSRFGSFLETDLPTGTVDDLDDSDSVFDKFLGDDDGQETTTDRHHTDVAETEPETEAGTETEADGFSTAIEELEGPPERAGSDPDRDETALDRGTEKAVEKSQDPAAGPATRDVPTTRDDPTAQDDESNTMAAGPQGIGSRGGDAHSEDRDSRDHSDGKRDTAPGTDTNTDTNANSNTESASDSAKQSEDIIDGQATGGNKNEDEDENGDGDRDDDNVLDLTKAIGGNKSEGEDEGKGGDDDSRPDLTTTVRERTGVDASGGDGRSETTEEDLSYGSDESLPSVDLSSSDQSSNQSSTQSPDETFNQSSSESATSDTPAGGPDPNPESGAASGGQASVVEQLMTEAAPQLLVVDNTSDEDNPFRIRYGLPRLPRRLFVISSSSEVVRQVQSSQYDVAQALEAVKILKMGSSGRGNPGRRETTSGTGLSIDVHQTSRQDDLSRVGILATQLLSDWESTGTDTAAQINAIGYLLNRFEDETVFDFLYTLTRMINTRSVTGLYYIDPGETNLKTFQTIQSLFDGVITYTGDGFETGIQDA